MSDFKYVLILGCGSVGFALAKQLLNIPGLRNLTVVDIAESSIFQLQEYVRNDALETGPSVEFILGDANRSLVTEDPRLVEITFDIVFHCAAYKHVGFCETNPRTAWANNLGLVTKLFLSQRLSTKRLVFISTDKAVNPTTQMGWTKRVSEWALQQWSQKRSVPVSIVRFGNVLASSGSIIPLLETQISSGGPVTITSVDAQRYFISLEYAASCLIKAADICEIGGPIYVIKMDGLVSILDLAKGMILASGKGWRMRGESEAPGYIDIDVIGLRQGEKVVEDLTEGVLTETCFDCLFRSEGELAPDLNSLTMALDDHTIFYGKTAAQIRELF